MDQVSESEQIDKRDLETREILHSYGPSVLVWLILLAIYPLHILYSHWTIMAIFSLLLAWMALIQIRSFQLLLYLRAVRHPFGGVQLTNNIAISIVGLLSTSYLAITIIFDLPLAWIAVLIGTVVSVCVNGMFPNLRGKQK